MQKRQPTEPPGGREGDKIGRVIAGILILGVILLAIAFTIASNLLDRPMAKLGSEYGPVAERFLTSSIQGDEKAMRAAMVPRGPEDKPFDAGKFCADLKKSVGESVQLETDMVQAKSDPTKVYVAYVKVIGDKGRKVATVVMKHEGEKILVTDVSLK